MVRIAVRRTGTRARGFVYLTALFAIALVGLGVSSYAIVWSQQAQREREQELLFIGNEFRRAIANYYEQSPGTAKRYPEKLDFLLFDARYLTIKRHLRRIYIDPMTSKASWGTVPAPDGGIMGIFSLSEKTPIKTGGFDEADKDFAGASKYSSWRFIYVPAANPELPGRKASATK